MVDQREDNREEFIINRNFAEESENLHQEEYLKTALEGLRKKPTMPFVIGAAAIVVLIILFIFLLSGPKNVVDQEYLQSLEARIQQLEKKLTALGGRDQTLDQLGRHTQELGLLENKLNHMESTVATQIDQIIKELGALHQKTAQNPAAVKSSPKAVKKKQPVPSKKAGSNTRFHTVQAGDTLYSISRRYGLSVEKLRSYNKLSPNSTIYPGQKLNLNPSTKE